MNMEQMPFRRTEKVPPSMLELEAAKKAAEAAKKEKEAKLKSEKKEREETERLRRLYQGAEQKTYVITKKDVEVAEEEVGKKFEKLN